MKILVRLLVLAAALAGGSYGVNAQTLPGAVPRPDPLVEPLPPLDPVEKIDAVMAYAEMSCTQLGAALKWHETRAVPQQIAAWNAAMRALPHPDPRAISGDYLRAIEGATLQALRDLLLYDVVSMATDAKELAADAVDRATYLQWIKSSRGDALDELSRRVVGSLGLQSGTRVADWDSPSGRIWSGGARWSRRSGCGSRASIARRFRASRSSGCWPCLARRRSCWRCTTTSAP